MIALIAKNVVELQRQERESGALPLLKQQLKDVQRQIANVNKAIAQGITAKSTMAIAQGNHYNGLYSLFPCKKKTTFGVIQRWFTIWLRI